MIKPFSNFDKTYCLKVPYFVTEVILVQKCINLLDRMHTIKFNGMCHILNVTHLKTRQTWLDI